MPVWSAASVIYFLYVLVLSVLMPGLPATSRRRAAASSALGLVLAVAAGLTTTFWLRSLVLPPLVLLIAYRASGFLWRGPMFGVDRRWPGRTVPLALPESRGGSQEPSRSSSSSPTGESTPSFLSRSYCTWCFRRVRMPTTSGR